MMDIQESALVITIPDSEPLAMADKLIKAIACFMRCYKAADEAGELYTKDGEHLYTLAQLQECLTLINEY